jgi:hypothetical protein
MEALCRLDEALNFNPSFFLLDPGRSVLAKADVFRIKN